MTHEIRSRVISFTQFHLSVVPYVVPPAEERLKGIRCMDLALTVETYEHEMQSVSCFWSGAGVTGQLLERNTYLDCVALIRVI